MIYTGSIIVPANTSSDTPTTTSIKMSAGVIHKLRVSFPPGCCGLVGIAFVHGGHRVYPSTETMWFRGDARDIEYNEWYELNAVINEIKVVAYSLDDTFEHEVRFEFGVLLDWQITPWLAVNKLIKFIQQLLAKMGKA